MEFREGMPEISGRGGNNLVPITLKEQRGHTVIVPLIIAMSLIIIILIVGAVSYYAAYWFLGGEK